MKYSLILIFLAIFYAASSQVVKFTTEESIQQRYPYELIPDENRSKTYFQDGNITIMIECNGQKIPQFAYTGKYSGQKTGVIIHKYDQNGDEISVNKFEKASREFGPILPVSVEFNNKILLFYFRKADNDDLKLVFSELDKSDLSLKNTQEVCSYGQNNTGVTHSKKILFIQLFLRLSDDKKKLLLAVPVGKDELFTCVYSGDMSIVRKKISQLVIKDDIMISEAVIENTGNNIIVFSDFVIPGLVNRKKIAQTILIQKANNTESIIDINLLGKEINSGGLHFGILKHSSKTILYSNYLGTIGAAGIWILDIETENLKINKPLVIPYPEDYAKRVYHLGFGGRKRDEYGLESVDYGMVEFENGDFALYGSPLNEAEAGNFLETYGNVYDGAVKLFSGPVMVAFISNNNKQNVFTMIPRYMGGSPGSKVICLPYKNKLIVIYNDFEKNITGELLSDDVHQKKNGTLSLAYASILKDGKIESRNILEEGSSKPDYYNTKNCRIISDKKVVIPSFHTEKKTNVIRVANITIE